ncbi:hypothetical protein GQ457_01G039450 [Hibiscus cannabinus]
MRLPGVEPGSIAWKAIILTVGLQTLDDSDLSLDLKILSRLSITHSRQLRSFFFCFIKNHFSPTALDSNDKSNGFAVNPLKNLVSGAKRGFSDAIDGPNGNGKCVFPTNGISDVPAMKEVAAVPLSPKSTQDKKNHVPPASKAQVVGWPLIRSFRKNTMASNSSKNSADAAGCHYVKVSMDGAPYLRKVDLNTYKNYVELSSALEKMFSCFTIGQCSSGGFPLRDGLSRLMNLLHGSEYVLTYEDKDGDRMLVGDVPWEMFTESCKRLRIMNGSEAIGLAPRAMEKCKNQN